MDDAIPPAVDAAVAVVSEFLRHAADLNDAATARTMMTARSVNVPAFDPRGLAGTQYKIGEPVTEQNMVIVPVALADASGQQATAPLVVVLEDGAAKIDVTATVELMMDGRVRFADEEGPT